MPPTDLERIESKLDKLSDTLSEQSVTLARNTATLELHVKRTDILEAHVLPLTAAHNRWVGAGKAAAAAGAVIAALAGLLGIVEGAVHVVGHFR